MAGFDIPGAKAAGYSNKEIGEFLLGTPEAKQAKRAGYQDNEILNHFGLNQPDTVGPIGSVLKGVYTSIADLLGTPVDLGNLLLKGSAVAGDVEAQAAQGKPIDPKEALETPAPFHMRGGSEDIKSAVQKGSEKAGLKKDFFVYKDYSELSPEDRPFAVGGEAYSLAAAPEMLLSKLGMTGKLAKLAETAPKTVKAIERAGAGGAAIGGAITATATDDPKKIAGGEILGSLVSPFAILTRAATSTGGEIGSGLRAAFGGSKDYKASQYLQKTLADAGEDPAKVAQMLRDHVKSGLPLTAGQASNSPVLLSLEKQFAARNARFGEVASNNARDSMASLRQAISSLEATNKPEALRVAAKLRQRYFDTLLNGQINEAKEDLVKSIAKLSPEGKAEAGDVSEQAFRILDTSLKKARKDESKLWGAIPQNVEAQVSNTLQAARNAKAQYLTDVSEVPPGLGDFFERGTPDNVGTVTWLWKNPKKTSGELLKLRSKSLGLMREAQAAGDWRAAAVYKQVSEGALADLNTVPGIQSTLTPARQFSNSLHDAFTRTFAGDALARDATGARAIEPETLLRRTLGGGREGANLRFDQLLGAAQFADRRLASAMSSVQERYLRQQARNFIDPNTGKVSAGALARWQQENAALLNQFPNLRADFKDVSTAQKALDDAVALQDKATKAMAKKAVFTRVVDNEDPVYVVGQVLREGNNPMGNYGQLARMAKASGPEAVGGLRAATIEHAYNHAFDSAGDFSWSRFRQNLTAPVGKSRTGVMDIMRSNGVMDAAAQKRLMDIVDRGERLENAMRFGGLSVEAPSEDMLQDLLITMATTKASKALSKPWGASGIVVQSAAAKAGRKLFEKLPNARTMDFIMQASEDPAVMADLLERPTSARQAKSLMGRVENFMEKGGYIPRGPFLAAGYEATQKQPQEQ